MIILQFRLLAVPSKISYMERIVNAEFSLQFSSHLQQTPPALREMTSFVMKTILST